MYGVGAATYKRPEFISVPGCANVSCQSLVLAGGFNRYLFPVVATEKIILRLMRHCDMLVIGYSVVR